MKYVVKAFHDLSTTELFEIYRQRIAVFVVEQQCFYQEVDDIDPQALHTWLRNEENEIVAYARVFLCGETVHFGRVLVNQKYRGLGFGDQLLTNVCQMIQEKYPKSPIEIGAQAHLQAFYGKFGFQVVSEPYLEDGIPHITMRKKSVSVV